MNTVPETPSPDLPPATLGIHHGLIGSVAIVAAMLGASAWANASIPPGARLPIHWNVAGKADGYGSATQALLLIPAISAGTALLMAAITKLEPRREHLRQSMRAYVLIWLTILMLLLVVHVAMLAAALGNHVDMTRVMIVSMGVMFVVIGNYMGKLRSNFFAGVRTPWTLSSELSWNKTHRLAGKLFVVLGLLSVVLGAIGNGFTMIALYAVATPAMLVWLLAYSYLVWKVDPDRRTT